MPSKGQKLSEEAKRLIREARAKQVHPSLAVRGYTLEMVMEERKKGNQWCNGDCKNFLPTSAFSKNTNSGRCRTCNNAYSFRVRRGIHLKKVAEDVAAGRRKRQESPEYKRLWDRTHKLGTTPEWYEKQLEIQDGKCAMCSEQMPTKGICIDHCHQTGNVRELLCISCNTFLGRVEKKPELYEFAMAYLLRHRP